MGHGTRRKSRYVGSLDLHVIENGMLTRDSILGRETSG